MYYSAKRQQFLIDQGYAFKVITNLLDSSSGGNGAPNGMLSTREEQLDLLAKVLAAGEEEAGEEVLPGMAPRAGAMQRAGGGANAVRRATGSLAALSGAGGLTYLEFQQRQRHEQQRKSTRTRMTTKSGKTRHILFRKREQGLL